MRPALGRIYLCAWVGIALPISSGLAAELDSARAASPPAEAIDAATLLDQVASQTEPSSYQWDLLSASMPVYIDRDYLYGSVPADYRGLCYLRTANHAKLSADKVLISIRIDQETRVYVAHDDRVPAKPEWLTAFQDSGDDLTIEGMTHSIFVKAFPPGTVSLGGNQRQGDSFNASMYTVMLEATGNPMTEPGEDGEDGGDELKILSMANTATGQTAITWLSVPEQQYQILFKRRVSESGWQTVSEPITANSPTTTWVGEPARNNRMGIFSVWALAQQSPPVPTSPEQPTQIDLPDDNRLIWNGENRSATLKFVNGGRFENSEVYAGNRAFAGPRPFQDNPWIWPGIWVNPAPMDLSGYEAIWLWAKANREGISFDVCLRDYNSSPTFGDPVNIDPYIEGGRLTTEYRLIKIPLRAFRTDGFSANQMTHIVFSGPGERTETEHVLYIDEIYAVTGGANSQEPAPAEIEVPAEIDFGLLSIGSESTQNLTVTNPGSLPVKIEISSIPGNGGDSFELSQTNLDLDPGEEQTIQVNFQPATPGEHDAELQFFEADGSQPLSTVEIGGVALDPPVPIAGADFTLSVNQVTSSKVDLSWPLIGEATALRVYLAPEPGTSPEAPLPDQELIAELPGDATGYQITELAAAVDVFVRVEAVTPEGVLAGNVHARTLGGPRARLDTPLRAVHGYAPNVLMLVLSDRRVSSYSLAGGDWFDGGVHELQRYRGEGWQDGSWEVRRQGGDTIGVTAVHRHSIPAGNNYYETGWKADKHLNLMDVDHRIYLVLEENIGPKELLRVEGPLSLGFWLPFSDRYLETPVIQVNQVGYAPQATERWAYVSGWMGDGGALSLDEFPEMAEVLAEPESALQGRSAVQRRLAIQTRSVFDEDAGTEVKQIDLSGLPASEETSYRVRVPGVGVSWPTAVSREAVFEAYATITRGLYYNRWGRELKQPYTDFGPRPADHTTVYTAEETDPWQKFDEGTPKRGERPLTGGHHDAGDFDIRVFHDTMPMLLMQAFEANPEAFTDGQLNIPESGNGIPDLLDEVLYNLRAWEQLQEEDGGVRMGAESWRHPWGYYYADEDPLTYWTYSRDARHSMRVAGLFAQASRLVSPFDAAKADELKTRALDAYNYARANGVGESIRGPILFAAGELYRLTGQSQYRTVFESAWGEGSGIQGIYDWPGFYNRDEQPVLYSHVLSYLNNANADAQTVNQIRELIATRADEAVQNVLENHAHRNGRPANGNPDWGRGTAVGQYLVPIYTRLMLGDLAPQTRQTYVNAISLSADYVLGANPMGKVWITGLGSRHPEDPLHLDSLALLADGQEILPGIPVYGPVTGLPNLGNFEYGSRVFFPAFDQHPLMRRYGDLNTFVVTNEFELSVQALQAQLLAFLWEMPKG